MANSTLEAKGSGGRASVAAGVVARPDTPVSPRQRNRAARQYLRAWLADESGYDEETWPLLRRALEEDRAPGQRRLFDGDQD